MTRVIACLGELLMRLSAPGSERLLQSNRLEVVFGGAEANVAVMLARLGHHSRIGSVLPHNALGEGVLTGLRGQGVDVGTVERRLGRLGLYFLTPAAMNRPAEVLYDRSGSAFATYASVVDIGALLRSASWLHVSGITPAVSSAAADLARGAVRSAAAAGVKVSFDGNYRAQLWQGWGGDGPAVLSDLLGQADLAFINEKDIALITRTQPIGRDQAVSRAFELFPKLSMIAATDRDMSSPTFQSLAGAIYQRDGTVSSRRYSLAGVIDRIGAGDAFAAGVLHGLERGLAMQETVEFATAAAALKHSIPGDFNIVDEGEIRALMAGEGHDVRR